MPKRPETPYEHLHHGFRWKVPQRFNIADVCCARWARETPDATAVFYEHENGQTLHCSYESLQAQANRLSHALQRMGVGRGDRVAIVMPQRIETAVAHIAIYQLGAVAMPLSMLFGPDALAYRLQHSDAHLALVDESAIANLPTVPGCAPWWPWAPRRGKAMRIGPPCWRGSLRSSPARSLTLTMPPCSSTPAAPPARPRAL